MNRSLVKSLLYDSENDIVGKLMNITDVRDLYLFMFNYNWSDGFEIPKTVIENKSCDLSTALLVFYQAEGQLYLEDRNVDLGDKELYDFIDKLYKMIISGSFRKSDVAFKVPLTKVQKYKMTNIISPNELIFLDDIAGESLDISI